MIDLRWPETMTDALSVDVHRIVHAVVAQGGAVGWLEPPDRDAVDLWLGGVLHATARGHGAVVVAEVDGRPRALATWQRGTEPVFAHLATVNKVMVHPDARGRGLARLVTGAVVDHARSAGIENLSLGVRGNNHLAIQVYESLGFTVWGRLPGAIAVGDLRFDDVRMYLRFPLPDHVVQWGSDPGGPGSSPARH